MNKKGTMGIVFTVVLFGLIGFAVFESYREDYNLDNYGCNGENDETEQLAKLECESLGHTNLITYQCNSVGDLTLMCWG